VTASIACPEFHSYGMELRSTIRWQHRLKREHPTFTERRSLITECGWKGGDRGPLGRKEKTLSNEKTKEPT
jgi:hypothetical protein